MEVIYNIKYLIKLRFKDMYYLFICNVYIGRKHKMFIYNINSQPGDRKIENNKRKNMAIFTQEQLTEKLTHWIYLHEI